MKKFFGEFKEFVLRGNVVDMAVGVIVGAAFKAIVDSLVTNILNPIIGLITGGMDLSNALIVTINTSNGQVQLLFGAFISSIITFILTAFALFLIVRGINKIRSLAQKKKEEEPAAAPEPSNEEKLLTEIRDLLKK